MPGDGMGEKRGQRRKGGQTAAGKKTVADRDASAGKKAVADRGASAGKKAVADKAASAGKKAMADKAASAGKKAMADKDPAADRKRTADEERGFRAVRGLLAAFGVLAVGILALCVRSSSQLPDTVGRVLTASEAAEVTGRNSPLIDYIFLSPNADFPRAGQIKKITIHHMAGDLELEALGENFSDRDRRASANYGIDSNGRIALYVEEKDRAWTSSSKENADQAVTIEVANDEIGGEWHVSDAAYASLITLCVDICQRNGIEELVFTGDEKGNLTLHKMFSDKTECPGPYLESRMEDIVRGVNERLDGNQ